MTKFVRPARIVNIIEGAYRYDAISDHLIDARQALADGTGWEVSVLTCVNERRDLPARLVSGVAELLLDRDFLSADLLIYHFGIWDPIFDALLIGNGHARQAVFFHNLTPVSLAPPKWRAVMERSFAQLGNLRCADRLWPVSRTNAKLLVGHGIDPTRIEIIPLAVGSPPIARLTDKPEDTVELLFLGRIVPHKGVRDLVEALSRLRCRDLPRFRLRIIGNLEESDTAYCKTVQQLSAGLGDAVEFIGTVENETRDRMLEAAHILAIPSYHEGFGKPVIEGLRTGCVPVGYTAENLRDIAAGLCRMVPPGNITALAEALAEVMIDVTGAVADPGARLRLDRGRLTAAEFTAAASVHVEQFRPERVRALMRNSVAALFAAEAGAPPHSVGFGHADPAAAARRLS
jgi:glycosyltransferase involved in cell wall biosynthesis